MRMLPGDNARECYLEMMHGNIVRMRVFVRRV